jgi:pantothenate synthetase
MLHGLEVADGSTLLALAVKIGQTRLIDNTVLGEEL